jgi:hypothetical protein
MKQIPLLILSMLAILAGGCASGNVPNSPDYQRYFDQEFPPAPQGKGDGPQEGAVSRNSPAVDAEGETDSFNAIDAINFENRRMCCLSNPRQ